MEDPLQVSMGISGQFDKTLVLEKEDSQADMFASDNDSTRAMDKRRFLSNEKAVLAEIEKVRGKW